MKRFPFSVALIACLALSGVAGASDFALEHELRTSDAVADDLFGAGVLVDGGFVFAGAIGRDDVASRAGAVYVFELGGDQVLTEVAKLLASDGGTSDRLGNALAIDGDVLVVGATFADGFTRGAAYIFEKPPGGWSGIINESARLVPSDRGSNDAFGVDVAIDGDTVVVGARGDDDTAGQEGAVYVFERPEAGWSGTLAETAKLVPAPRAGANSGELGTSVAIEGGVVVSGSRSQSQGSDSRQGRGLVFLEPPGGWAGVINETAVLVASDGQSGDRLGRSVAIDQGVIAIGATAWDRGASNTNDGAVYVFEEPPGGWAGELTEAAILTSSEPFNNEALGIDVALEGDTIIAGTDYDGSGGGTRESVYVFQRPAGGWSGTLNEIQRLEDDVTGANNYGNEVSFQGGRIVTGARNDDLVAANAGRAYVYATALLLKDGFEP